MDILVIENGTVYKETLSRKFNNEDYTIDSVDKLELAIEKLKTMLYNLIIISWNIAPQNSIEDFMHFIKKDNTKNSIFVINSVKNKYMQIAALNGGADDYHELEIKSGVVANEDSLAVLLSRIDARLRLGGTM